MRFIDRFLDTEVEYFGVKVSLLDLLFGTALLALGIIFRVSLFEIQSGDYVLAFADWMRECHEAGGFAYLGIEPGISDASTFDYNCMFQYIIVLLHYIGGNVSDMYLVKTVSVVFDILCAVTVMRITYNVTGYNVKKSLLAFGAMMFLPTAALNSGAWAQNDSIYASFILLSLLSVIKGKDNRAFIYLAISYSFKQQAIFFMPFIIIMWLKNRVKIRYIFWIPVIYIVAMVPAAVAGREWSSLLGIYKNQMGMFSRLSMNYPSIYCIITSDMEVAVRKVLISAGVSCTIAIFGVIAYYVRSKKFEITSEYMITLVMFTILVCCFCLPTMHERYAYIPEVLAVIYGVMKYKGMVICAVLQVITMITYTRFLFGSTVTIMWPLMIAMLTVILILGYDLYRQMKIPEGANA
ncbi:MAG: hypothetical protein K6G10_03600 [Butyrivibrio sp.]|nr:hypothetical protein [Butyrivibrio sp.]